MIKYQIIVGRKMRPKRSAPPTMFDNFYDAEDFGIRSYRGKFYNIRGGWRIRKFNNNKIVPLTDEDLAK